VGVLALRVASAPTVDTVPAMTDIDFKAFNAGVIEEFRANHGTTTGMFAQAPLVLVTTTGAKSGKAITVPLVHTTDGDDVVIIASKGGAPSHPDWFHNIKANPAVTVELPDDVTFEATAVITDGDERRRLFDAQAEQMPNFKEYEQATDREIPVVRLVRNT
jgi:deazaflavin-dependent oxidoreductase (nitroreductase family)